MCVDVQTDHQLPLTTPEAQGIPSSAVLDFVSAAEERIDALHGFVLVRHGHVVAQGSWAPYDVDSPRTMFSLSKSFTSSAVGLAVDEGRLSVDDPVLPFFPGAAPETVSGNLDELRVRHLLTMTTGHAEESLGPRVRWSEGDWTRAILAMPVDHTPGTHFVYNSGASYLLSAIVQRVTGETLLDYLRPRLLLPLGITDATWESCPRGINVGGWGLAVRASEIARFGQLYLQGGMWRGRQLLPREWVAAATARQVDNDGEPRPEADWRQGYGYQFWRARHGAYRGDGAFGQFCLVLPEQDAVLAIVGGLSNMQAVLDLVWEHLLPAMGSAALPSDDTARTSLEQRLAGLSLAVPAGRPSTPASARVAGRAYHVRPERHSAGETPAAAGPPERPVETISLDAVPGGWRLTVKDDAGVHEVVGAAKGWHRGHTSLASEEDEPVATHATWIDDDTCELTVCYLRSPFLRTLTLAFAGDQVTMAARTNVSFGRPEAAPVTGHLD